MKHIKNKTTYWILLWLIIAGLGMLITGTYAAYTRAEYVKRVVASKNESSSYLFSSNYMYMKENSYTEFPLRIIPVSTQADLSLTVTVCNYLQSDLTRFSEDAISYTFTAALADINGNLLSSEKLSQYAGVISISGTQYNAGTGTYTASGTLEGGTANTHFYEIRCSKDNVDKLNDICIRLEAVPENSPVKLVALLSMNSGTRSDTPWTGKFAEVTDDDQDTTDIDAFNYVISGTSETTVKINWNTARVMLSPWSRQEFSPDSQVVSEGKGYIEVKVGATAQSYTLQFYRVNGIPSGEKGADVKGYVSLTESS